MRSAILLCLLLFVSCRGKIPADEIYRNGVIEFEKKNFTGAEQYFNEVISEDDDFLNAYLMLSKIYYYNKRYDAALDNTDKILRRECRHPGALYWKARILVMSGKGKPDECIDGLKRVLEVDSHHIQARLLLALLYERSGMNREALHEYLTVIEEEGNIVNARGNLAILYHRLGLRDRGINEIDRALKIADAAGIDSGNIRHIKREFER